MALQLNELTNKTEKLADAGSLTTKEKEDLKKLDKATLSQEVKQDMKISLKGSDGKLASLKVEDVIKAIDTKKYTSGDSGLKASEGVSLSIGNVNYSIGWGSEAGAVIQLFLLAMDPNYTNTLNAKGGVDGKLGSNSMNAIKDYVSSQKMKELETKVTTTNKTVEVIDNADFFKNQIPVSITKMNLNNRVKDASVKAQLSQYVDANGVLKTDKYHIEGTSYDKMTIVFNKFEKNNKVKNRSVEINKFMDQSGNFDQGQFVTRFENAVKAMIKEDHDQYVSAEKAKEVSSINALLASIDGYVATTNRAITSISNKSYYLAELNADKANLATAKNKLNAMKPSYASKELAGAKAKIPAYEKKFNDKIAETNRGIYADAFKGNKLVDKTSKLADATDTYSVSRVQGSLDELKTLKTNLSKDVVNYVGKDAEKAKLLSNIDLKIQDAEGQLKFIAFKDADGKKLAELETNAKGNLTEAATFLNSFAAFQAEFESHTASYLTHDNANTYGAYTSRMDKLADLYYALRPNEKPASQTPQSRRVAPGVYESSDI